MSLNSAKCEEIDPTHTIFACSVWLLFNTQQLILLFSVLRRRKQAHLSCCNQSAPPAPPLLNTQKGKKDHTPRPH